MVSDYVETAWTDTNSTMRGTCTRSHKMLMLQGLRYTQHRAHSNDGEHKHLLGRDAVLLGKQFPTFWGTVVLSSSQSGSPSKLFILRIKPLWNLQMSEATPPMTDHLPEDVNLQVNTTLGCLYHIRTSWRQTRVWERLAAVYNMITGRQSVRILKAPVAGSTVESRIPAEAVWCDLNPV
jgi:hypothetical protein